MKTLKMLKKPTFFVRSAARERLFRPALELPLRAVESALAEPERVCVHMARWLDTAARPTDWEHLLPLVDRARGTSAEQRLVARAALQGGPGVVAWAEQSLQHSALAVGLRGGAVSALLRWGPAAAVDVRAELEVAKAVPGGVQTLIRAVVDGAVHLDPLRACTEHPELGLEVLTTMLGALFDGGVHAARALSACDTIAQLEGLVSSGPIALEVPQEVHRWYALARSGDVAAWSGLASDVEVLLAGVPDEAGPPGGGRRRARVIRTLLAAGPTAVHGDVLVSVLVLAVAQLTALPDDDALFNGPHVGIGTLLEAADHPLVEGHPSLVAALVRHGLAGAAELKRHVDATPSWRSLRCLEALTVLAWWHPGQVDDAASAAVRCLQAELGSPLADAALGLLAELGPSAAPVLMEAIMAEPELGSLLHPLLGRMGGAEARTHLLTRARDAPFTGSGVRLGLERLGDVAALELLTPLEPVDPTAEVAQTLVVLAALHGANPPSLGGWRERVAREAALEASRRDRMWSKLTGALGAASSRPEASTAEASARRSGSQKSKRRKKGKRRR